MKKQTPSTFILNADDKNYFFVEGKSSRVHGPIYHVYYDAFEKPVIYSANNFIEEHGTNSKIPVLKFIQFANYDLIALQGINPKAKEAYNILNDINLKIRREGFKKSVLRKHKKNLVSAICTYNEIKPLLPKAPEISYEEDYEFIKSLENINKQNKVVFEKHSERKTVKRIEDINDGYQNITPKQRILKKAVKYD